MSPPGRERERAIQKGVEPDSRLTFEPRMYECTTAKGQVREAPMYLLSKDDFALVMMGFTGAKARRWHNKFIAAFNRMEAEPSCAA